MSTTIHARRALAATRAVLAAITVMWLTAACTGTSTGRPDPGAAGRAGDQAQQFAVDNGHLIAAIVVGVAGAMFIAFLWRSPAMRIVGALFIGGAIVYYGMGGGR